jgi:hypothetical protein
MFKKLAFVIVLALLAIGTVSAQTVFKINVDSAVAKEPLSGRLLIFMTNNPKPLEGIDPAMLASSSGHA